MEPARIDVADADGVRFLTLNRPGAHNAIGSDMLALLHDAVEAAAADDAVRALVLTGAGGMFSAGGDLASLLASIDSRDPAEERAALAEAVEPVAALLRFPKPSIAMVNGAAAGGAIALTLACDLRVASTEALFAYAYPRIALAGDLGMNWLLTRLLGPARARRVAFAPSVSAQEALRLGLVDDLFAPGDLASAVADKARRLAMLSPGAVVAIKRNLDAAPGLSFADACAMEADSFVTLRGAPDHRVAVEAMLKR